MIDFGGIVKAVTEWPALYDHSAVPGLQLAAREGRIP
jgi:hypothetical protein